MNNIRVSLAFLTLTSATPRRIRLQSQVSESQCAINASVWASANGRLCRSRETATTADYFLPVRRDLERIATLSIFLSGAVSVCATFTYTFYDYTLVEIWMLQDIHNYRLTRARMVECAFGIVCNKWRIFHRAIDVCPDFCDVTVKTCCILHNFVHQRDAYYTTSFIRETDGFQFHNTLCECSL
jgi:hypothetical protein